MRYCFALANTRGCSSLWPPQQSGPLSVRNSEDMPWTRLTATSRRLVPADLMPVAKQFLDFAFSRFATHPRPAGLQDIQNSAASGDPGSDSGEVPWRIAGRPRRYAGDPLSAMCQLPSDLARERYHAILASNGSDCGTLLAELAAYSSPEDTGSFDLFDPLGCAIRDPTGGPVIAAVVVQFKRDSPVFERFRRHCEDRITAEEFAKCSDSPSSPDITIFLQNRFDELAVERVIDLRLPATRSWFFDRYKEGVLGYPGWGQKVAGDDFDAMLPALLSQKLGGEYVTQVIGADLRSRNASGLVFPSARCNCTAQILEGQLVHWNGWNFVDYRGAPPPIVQNEGQLLWLDAGCAMDSEPTSEQLDVFEDVVRKAIHSGKPQQLEELTIFGDPLWNVDLAPQSTVHQGIGRWRGSIAIRGLDEPTELLTLVGDADDRRSQEVPAAGQ
jgi:hypothetical protein